MSTINVGTFVRLYIATETDGEPSSAYLVQMVSSRDTGLTLPSHAYAFQFFNVHVTFYTRTADSDCDEVDASPKYFVAGRVMTLEQVQLEFPSEHEVLFKAQQNGCPAVIRTPSGDFYPFDSSNCVLLSESR